MIDSAGKGFKVLKETFNFVKATFAITLNFVHSPREGIKLVHGVSFYRNAVYLMSNSGVQALSGFVFWVVVAKFHSPRDIGLASALISTVSFISFLAQFGVGSGIIRFLPNYKNKIGLLNSSFTSTALAAMAISSIFLVGLPLWSPKLGFVRESPILFATFVVVVTVATVSGIATYVFISFRRSGFTLAYSLIFGLLNIGLVILLTSIVHVLDIFSSWGVAAVISLIVCLFIFLPQILPNYRPIPTFKYRASGEMVRFSLANYVAEAVGGLPVSVLPLMVVNILSAEANAYFFVSWSIAGILQAISSGVSVSLFAEGSFAEGKLAGDIRRSLKIIILLLIPAVIVMFLLGQKLLLLFGREYSAEGTKLLWLLASAAIPLSINYLYQGILRVEKKLKGVLLINGVTAISTLTLSYLLLPSLGILGAGVGWLTTQTAVALVLLFRLKTRFTFKY